MYEYFTLNTAATLKPLRNAADLRIILHGQTDTLPGRGTDTKNYNINEHHEASNSKVHPITGSECQKWSRGITRHFL
jgi:hypothetical protein